MFLHDAEGIHKVKKFSLNWGDKNDSKQWDSK